MEEAKHDDLFFNILKEEVHLVPFLNSFFGFLYRRTDFYCVQENPKGKIGFPLGVAEKIVHSVYKKWEQVAHPPNPPKEQELPFPDVSQLVLQEVEVETTPFAVDEEVNEEKPDPGSESIREIENLSSDTYNGADCGNYRWSQTIQDIDIIIPVKKSIVSAINVIVEIESKRLSVQARGDDGRFEYLVKGELTNKNIKDDSVWSIVPGRHLLVHLEKFEEKWWQSLLTTEPPIDLTSIDAVRPITDLVEEEQMKIEEIMWNENRKRQGLLTSKQMELEAIMRQAWDVEGSPFQGTPFDPSVITDYPTQNS